MDRGGLRVGVDVGGTFTKAVAVRTRPLTLRASAVVPTTHSAAAGVTDGVAAALRALLADLGEERGDVELVAFSTTTAMNALLEGDVATVGIVGIGAEPDLRLARRRTAVGQVKLAPGRALHTQHEFLDATRGLDEAAVDAAVARLAAGGCTAVAVSGAFAVDSPEHEQVVRDRARAHGMPACAGSELTGAYGLETRTLSAAINASILPVVERTAGIVEQVLHEAGIDVPLLVLRGDGGSMSLEAFRRAPSFTIGSGPAAGVAAALLDLRLSEGIVLECGGTSSNVSVVTGGRTAMRTLRVMGRPTAIRSVDSWVVGAAGGSMALLGRRRIEETGPRSAHVAGLPYACFGPLSDLDGARLEVVAPRAGDPEAYAAVVGRSGTAYALTATCAAHALGLAEGAPVPAGHDATASALAAFAPLGRAPEALGARGGAGAAGSGRREDRARRGRGGARARVRRVRARRGARRSGARAGARGGARARPAGHAPRASRGPVVDRRGAVARARRGDPQRRRPARHRARGARRRAGLRGRWCSAADRDRRDRSRFAHRHGARRRDRRRGARVRGGGREAVGDDVRRAAAAAAVGAASDELRLLVSNEYYDVYGDDGEGRFAVVDGVGSVPIAERAAKRIVSASSGGALLEPLRAAVRDGAVNLGVAELLPRVAIVCGARIVDLSDARRIEDILSAAEAALAGQDGAAIAVVRG